jgi:hypothetical protein
MTQEAMASTQVMSTCMAMGEAAGKAAGIAVMNDIEPKDVDIDELRGELPAEGAYLRSRLRLKPLH